MSEGDGGQLPLGESGFRNLGNKKIQFYKLTVIFNIYTLHMSYY